MILAIVLAMMQIPGSGLATKTAVSAIDTKKPDHVAVLRAPEALPEAASASVSTTVAPALAMVVPNTPQRKRSPLPPPNRKAWLALTIIQHSAASFDAWTTRHKMEEGRYRETNPLLKPFANNASIYFAVQGVPLAMDFAGRRMQTSNHRMLRKLWWLPQTAQAATSMYFGISNLRK